MNVDFDELGAGDPPLLFLHGWCCDRSYFAPQVDHFARSHRVVAVDQRGHGKTPPAGDGDYSIDAFAADAVELIGALDLDRPVLVGHSLGGVISLAVGASHPELVRGVVMVDPAPIVMGDDMRAFFQTLGPTVQTVEGRQGFVNRMFAATDDAGRKAQIVEAMASVDPAVAVPAITGLLEFDGPAALAACTVPIASIASMGAANDPAALREHCSHLYLAQTLGAGHFNQLEVPDQVNAMIEQFLRLLPAT